MLQKSRIVPRYSDGLVLSPLGFFNSACLKQATLEDYYEVHQCLFVNVYALIDPQIQLKKNKTRKFTCSQMPYVHYHWNKVWKCS